MAPKKIRVEGVGGVKLSSSDDYRDWLKNKGVQCLKDDDEFEIVGFESLVGGGEYTLGPPKRQQQQQQQQQQQHQQHQQQSNHAKHKSVAKSVFVLYCGGDQDATPIGTAFAISDELLLTSGHNVAVSKNGQDFITADLKVVSAMVKSSAGVMTPENGPGIPVSVHKYHIDHDWACLRRTDGNTFLSAIPVATELHELPEDATLDKLFIYHCPVQLFLDDVDGEMERLHVMVKEASVGIVNPKNLNFQNGGFPGSSGGPYIFHNKAVALHVDSVSTTTTVKDLQDEVTSIKNGEKAGEKRKVTIAEMTTRIAESCASSRASLGTGIILQVRKFVSLLKDERIENNDLTAWIH